MLENKLNLLTQLLFISMKTISLQSCVPFVTLALLFGCYDSSEGFRGEEPSERPSINTPSISAQDFQVSSIKMDSESVIIDATDYVINSTETKPMLKEVSGAQFGTVKIIPGTLEFTYTPNNLAYGVETLTYTVTDNKEQQASARIQIGIDAPNPPQISDILITEHSDLLTTVVTCSDCDLAQTAYQYDIDGNSVSNDSEHYSLNDGDKAREIGVTVTVKSKYCNVVSSNACKTSKGRLIVTGGRITSVSSYNNDSHLGQTISALKNDNSVFTWSFFDNQHVSFPTDKPRISTTNARNTAVLTEAHRVSIIALNGIPNDTGGDTSLVDDKLFDIVSITANLDAFAALRNDGRIITWGHPNSGAVDFSETLTNITNIWGGYVRFLAKNKDGDLAEWGGTECYDKPNDCISIADIQQELGDVTDVIFNSGATAAINDNGTVTTWGVQASGGNTSDVKEALKDVQDVFASPKGFTALRSDGSLVVWGEVDTRGLTANSDGSWSTTPAGRISNGSCYNNGCVGILENNTVVAWGKFHEYADVLEADYVTIGADGFIVVHKDGTVTGWGEDGSIALAANTEPFKSQLINVTQVIASQIGFTALTKEGKVVSLGTFVATPPSDELYGGLTELKKQLNF
ncbi:Ig-like domain-containing protein [Vibrio coralliirubri]|uniref:Ig-like domain-containing protein n=1 Tax=Vibrio coralliirubri TaxID=1516159 RepID=UPI000A384E07|nr:Ig-like domain-containing protein [Vibrio coralliirubri]